MPGRLIRIPQIPLALHTLLATLLILLLAGCSTARNSFEQAREAEEQGRFEEAMYLYAKAFQAEPQAGLYRLRFLQVRERAARSRFEAGQRLMDQRAYPAAREQFQTAAALDPGQAEFQQQAAHAARLSEAARLHQEGLAHEQAGSLKLALQAFQQALQLHPDNPDYQQRAARSIQRPTLRLNNHTLLPVSSKPLVLRFRSGQLKELFARITQQSGVQFLFDEAVKDQRVTLPLDTVPLQQALALLADQFKLEYATINSSTVLVHPQTAEKSKQYQDLVVTTLPLTYLDAKKAANLVRTMLQVRRLYINEEANALVVRDTREVADVVEKILEANDLPDAEVVLDVEVIEVSDKNAKNVGLLLSNYNVQLGAFSPSNKLMATSLRDTTTTPAGTVTTDADISNLVKAFAIKGFGGYVTVPNAQYNFGKTLANGEVLSNPKIRVKNREKAKFNVGTRVPITTATLATTGTLSQTNVQYVDVGIKVNAEPTIQLNNEVSIKLGLEVSSIISRETVGGADSATTVVTIGTRNLDTVLSLKDGETSVIGGLISRSSSDSTQKIFLLGDIPLIGPLISNTETSKDKTELILAITPRLVRGVTVAPEGLAAFASGKEDRPLLPVRLQRPLPIGAAELAFHDAQQTAQHGSGLQQPATPLKPGTLKLEAPATLTVGEQLTVLLTASDLQSLKEGTLTISYPAERLQLLAAEPGPLLDQSEAGVQATLFRLATGSITLTIPPHLAPAAAKGGTLASLTFETLSPGMARLEFIQADLTSMVDQPIPLTATATEVTIN